MNGKTSQTDEITAIESDLVQVSCYDNEAFDESLENESNITNIKSPNDSSFVLVNRNILPKSDFSQEVRAKLDAKHYFQEMTIMLDVASHTLEQIVHSLLTQVKLFCFI